MYISRSSLKKSLVALLTGTLLSSGAWAEPAPGVAPNLAQTGEAQEAEAVEAPAEEGEEEEEPRFKFRGYQSTGYSINFDRPSTGTNTQRVYDFDDRELKLDLLNLDFQYNVARPGNLGIRADLTTGQSHPRVDAATGLFRNFDTGFSDTGFDFRQLYLTYMTDGGVRFDVGKFATHIGYEVMDGVDGANSNATRSWAFLYGPFTHTGAKISYQINDEWSVMGLATLGWDQFRDVNDSVSFGAQVGFTPTKEFAVYANYIRGPEDFGNDDDVRQLLDITASYQVHERIKLGANMLWGRTDNFVAPNVDGRWNALIGYMDTKLTDKFSMNFRYEFFNDDDGVRTATSQYLEGLTISPAYEFNENWLLRADVRFDTSTADVYDHRGLAASSQSTLFFNNVIRF